MIDALEGNASVEKRSPKAFQKQPPEVFYKKCVFKIFAKSTGKRPYRSLFFNKVCNFIKKETPTRVFSSEF